MIDDSNVGGINVWKKFFLMKNVENAIDRVTQYFEIPLKDAFYVIILNSKKYEGGRKAVYLDKDGYNKKSMIVHEVTHALLKLKEHNFELEGIAMLMEYKFINDTKVEKERYIRFRNRNDCDTYPIQYLIENDQLYYPNTKIGRSVYMQSGLFYLFLDEKYGRKKMLEFYTQGVRRIESVYGVPLDSLDAAWQKWLLQ
ncbi:MAG: hypothetical protein OEM52_00540 [bacterium]|nr:hypothetical protein [bacterium]